MLTGSARQAQEAKERSDGTAGSRTSSSAGSTWSADARRSRRRPPTLWREFEDEADVVERLLSHGSTGAEDRAGQRAEQGRLRGADADADEPSTAGTRR